MSEISVWCSINANMVRWGKKDKQDKQDKRILLTSLNQIDTDAKHETDNGK